MVLRFGATSSHPRHSRPQDPSLPRSAAAISPSTAPSPFPPPTLRSAARQAVRVCSGLVGFVRLCSGCPGSVSGCSLSGRGDFAWSGLFGFVQVCSAPFGVFRAGVGLLPIWSGRFSRGRVCSDLFRFVRLCSGWTGPVSDCSLSGQGDFAWSGLFGFVQVCSALFGVFGADGADGGGQPQVRCAVVGERRYHGAEWDGAARRRRRPRDRFPLGGGNDGRDGSGMTEGGREYDGWGATQSSYSSWRRTHCWGHSSPASSRPLGARSRKW